ncbi:MAG: CaiB/BaiF CoA transferase family protein [Sphingomonadaceae bacterium]
MARGLTGLRVLDLSQALSGPYAGMILGDLGAEVIKIEPPGGEIFRNLGPYYRGGWSSYFVSIHRNKKGVVLDLKKEGGRQAFLDLAKVSDVVLNNFRPGVLERLGIPYSLMKDVNPRVIVASITGYGSTGSCRHKTAFDLAVQAASGVLSVTGTEDGELVKCGVPVADLAAGMFAVIGILTALREREVSGQGQHVDVSMFDTQLSMLSYQISWYTSSGDVPKPIGTSHLGLEPYGAYKTKDGYLVWTIGTEDFWRQLCRVLGVPDLAFDPRFDTVKNRHENRAELKRILEEILSTRTTSEWMVVMEKAGIPAAPVNNLAQALEEPCVRERHMLVEVDQPGYGKAYIAGNPVKLSRTGGEEFTPTPALGEHTVEVLREVAGYSAAKIEQLLSEKSAVQGQLLTV